MRTSVPLFLQSCVPHVHIYYGNCNNYPISQSLTHAVTLDYPLRFLGTCTVKFSEIRKIQCTFEDHMGNNSYCYTADRAWSIL